MLLCSKEIANQAMCLWVFFCPDLYFFGYNAAIAEYFRCLRFSDFDGNFYSTLWFSTVVKRIPDTDIVFAISATSEKWLENFQQMQDTITSVLDTYSMDVIRVGVIVFGQDTEALPIQQNLDSNLQTAIGNLIPKFGNPDIPSAIKEAIKMFKNSGRPSARRVLVVISDQASDTSQEDIKAEAERLTQEDIILISVVIGDQADPKELEKFTPHNVTETTSDEDPKELASKIMVLVLTGKSVNFFTAVFVNTCSTFYTQPVTI